MFWALQELLVVRHWVVAENFLHEFGYC